MLEDLEKVKSEVLDDVLKQFVSVNELVDDALSVQHLNTKNILLNNIKEAVKQAFAKFLVVSRMVKDMNFNEDINDLYCKSLMKQFGFNDLDSTDYDKVHAEAAKNLRKSRPFFTPVSKQDYEALKLSSDYDEFDDSCDGKSVNEILEEGMKEYGYERDDTGKWVDPKQESIAADTEETPEKTEEPKKNTKRKSRSKKQKTTDSKE
jgi:hypothetical protein